MDSSKQATTKHAIRNRWTDAVIFECDVPAEMASDLRTRFALEKAVESGAYLSGANLSGACAYLSDANLSGAKWRDGIVINKAPIQISGLHWFVTILDQHMQIGCELHSLAEWSEFDDRRIAEMDGRDALRFWRESKDALLCMARAAGRSFEPVVAEEVTA